MLLYNALEDLFRLCAQCLWGEDMLTAAVERDATAETLLRQEIGIGDEPLERETSGRRP